MLRIREATRDDRRAQLAEAYLAEQKLNDQKAEVLGELNSVRSRYAEAAASGVLNVDRLLDSHRHQLVLGAQLTFLGEQTAKLAPEIEKRRQALVVADREVRVLEKLRETLKDRHLREQQVIEMKTIDEVAGRLFYEASAQGGSQE
jgi:flagellar export protein FliJ